MNSRPTRTLKQLATTPDRVAACLALSCLLVALPACGPERQDSAAANGDVVARVGDDVIRVGDVEQEIALRVERGAQVPALDALVRDMIERRLILAKAAEEGLDQDPDLRRSWENLLIGRYKENHLREELRGIEIAEEDIRARYEGDAGRYSLPAKARLAILTLPFSPVMTDDERKAVVDRMNEGRTRALEAESGGLGFGALAVRYSEDQVTRHRGGDTGWLDDGMEYRWPREVVTAGFALKTGETSDPIVLEDAVHLVRKLDERPASSIPFDQVRDQIRKEILSTRIREQEAAFSDGLAAGTAVETFPDTLSKIRIPAQPRQSDGEAQPPAVP